MVITFVKPKTEFQRQDPILQPLTGAPPPEPTVRFFQGDLTDFFFKSMKFVNNNVLFYTCRSTNKIQATTNISRPTKIPKPCTISTIKTFLEFNSTIGRMSRFRQCSQHKS